MKFLKNNIKIVIISFITALICSCASVFATYTYLSKDVSYKKSDGTEVSVEEALNQLYQEKKDNKQMRFLETTQFDSTHQYTYVKNYDLKQYNNYTEITTNDIYIVVDAIAPAGTSNSVAMTDFIYFQKVYDNQTGTLTVTLPYQSYCKIGTWVRASIYVLA